MLMDKSSIHERSIFQLGNWHIVESGFPVSAGHGIYAVHTGCEHNNCSDGPIRVIHNSCYRCGEDVPNELQALVILHAWGWDE